MDKYFIGGIETNDESYEIFKIDNTKYVFSDKFKAMLRDKLIDWGTFLEIYGENVEYDILFNEINKLLDINDNENLKNVMLPMIQKIYNLPEKIHVSLMIKQFNIYEPLSIAIYSIFNTFKCHFEYVVHLFIEERNKYIENNSIKVKLNNWKDLLSYWSEVQSANDIDTSSVILLFLNPPNEFSSKIHYKLSAEFEKDVANLKEAISKFHYAGFCPKVPIKRLAKLLEFPLKDFINIIKKINPEVELPDYTEIENNMRNMLKNINDYPIITDSIPRKIPPENLTDDNKNLSDTELQKKKLNLIKWYVTSTLELRKKLLESGKKLEKYYINVAKLIVDINNNIKALLPCL